MKFRIHIHSRPGIWKYYKGFVDVDAPTIHQAVTRAKKRLYTVAFPSRPSGTWIVDDVQINRLAFEAEESRSR
jgi:hypothetical protein